MRIILAGGSAEVWQQIPDRPMVMAAILDALRRDVVASMGDAEYAAVKQSLKSVAKQNLEARKLLEALRLVPLTSKSGSPPVDARLDSFVCAPPITPLEEALSDPGLRKLLERRQAGVRSDEHRDHVYERVLQPLASSARGVTAVDPFTVEHLLSGRRGLEWLLTRLADDGIEYVKLLAVVKPGETLDRRQIQVALDALNRRCGSKLRLNLTAARGAPHDRHLRFSYADPNRWTPTIDIGKGFDTFNQEVMAVALKVESADSASAMDRENCVIRAPGREVFKSVP